jgi:transcriptional regulator GlxA family with amidase domain
MIATLARIAEHRSARLSVEDLADRMWMSVRNFGRAFTREGGTTPSQYVLQVRVRRRVAHLSARVTALNK